jgi:lysozyme
MDYKTIKNQLVEHEGLRLKPYKCTAGKLPIGVGRNIEDVGISKSEAMQMLDNDITMCVHDLESVFVNFYSLPENIQHVLINMRFQLGPKRFRGFRMMISAVKDEDWQEMVRQMKDSAWYGQTTNRANDLIRMVQAVA